MADDAMFHRVLRPGERLLWSGEPMLRPFTKADPFLVPLSLVLLGVTTAVFAAAIEAGPVAIVLAAQWLVFALHLSVGRLALRFDRRRRTTYALTPNRVIEAVDGVHLRSREVALGEHTPIATTAEGRLGCVRFGEASRVAQLLGSSGLVPSLAATVAFVDVEGAEKLAEAARLIGARNAARSTKEAPLAATA